MIKRDDWKLPGLSASVVSVKGTIQYGANSTRKPLLQDPEWKFCMWILRPMNDYTEQYWNLKIGPQQYCRCHLKCNICASTDSFKIIGDVCVWMRHNFLLSSIPFNTIKILSTIIKLYFSSLKNIKRVARAIFNLKNIRKWQE